MRMMLTGNHLVWFRRNVFRFACGVALICRFFSYMKDCRHHTSLTLNEEDMFDVVSDALAVGTG